MAELSDNKNETQDDKDSGKGTPTLADKTQPKGDIRPAGSLDKGEDEQDAAPQTKIISVNKEKFNIFWVYAVALRLIFFIIGIGGVLLFMIQSSSFAYLPNNYRLPIILYFLIGLLLQLIGMIVSKASHWYIFYGTLDENFKQKALYKIIKKVTMSYLFVLAIDVLTLIFFLSAGYYIFRGVQLFYGL